MDVPVHELRPEELVEYVKRCATLRSSAQTRKAAIAADVPKKPKKKDSVGQAMELLGLM